jgi:hypothetical protein
MKDKSDGDKNGSLKKNSFSNDPKNMLKSPRIPKNYLKDRTTNRLVADDFQLGIIPFYLFTSFFYSFFIFFFFFFSFI